MCKSHTISRNFRVQRTTLSCDGCMIASCMTRNFARDQVVGIVCPGILQVVCMKAISFGRVKVPELKFPGRCGIPG